MDKEYVYIKKITMKLRGDCADCEIETNKGKWHVFMAGSQLNAKLYETIPETVTDEIEKKMKYKEAIASYLRPWGYQRPYFDSDDVIIVANTRVLNPILAVAFLIDSWTAGTAAEMAASKDEHIEVTPEVTPMGKGIFNVREITDEDDAVEGEGRAD